MMPLSLNKDIKKLLREYLSENDSSRYARWVSNITKKTSNVLYAKTDLISDVDSSEAMNDIWGYQKKVGMNKVYKTILSHMTPNECFNNSAMVVDYMNNNNVTKSKKVGFVLGFVSDGDKLFGHAWNVIDGLQYDFTVNPKNMAYHQVSTLYDMETIENLSVFNPDSSCAHALSINGQNYDKDGMCSIYPFFNSSLAKYN